MSSKNFVLKLNIFLFTWQFSLYLSSCYFVSFSRMAFDRTGYLCITLLCFWLRAFLMQVGPDVRFGSKGFCPCYIHFTLFVLYQENAYNIWYVLSTSKTFLSASLPISYMLSVTNSFWFNAIITILYWRHLLTSL